MLTLNASFSSVLTNTGTLSAVNGATLSLSGSNSTIYNYGGTISATGTSNSSLPSDVDIGSVNLSGGQLVTDAAGRIRIASQSTLADLSINGNLVIIAAVALSNVSLSGQVTQSSSTTLFGIITNNANWTNSSQILLGGAVGLQGNGTITLSSAGTISGSGGSNSSLTVGAGQTIQGNGTLTFNGPLNNSGTIRASGNGLLTVNIGVSGGNNSVPAATNTGTIVAANSSMSVSGFANALLYNAGGVIMATGSAGNLALSCLTISGGLLSTDALAQITLNGGILSNVSASGTFVGSGCVSLQNITFSGSYTNTSGTTTLNGTNTNNGNLTVGQLTIISPSTLNGNGTLTITGAANAIGSNTSLAIGAGQTLTGNGTLSFSLPVNNAGTLLASGNTTLHISTNALTNTATISATVGGDVELNDSGGNLTNIGGTVSATSASPRVASPPARPPSSTSPATT